MFKVNENYEVDRKILKCDYIRYSPSEISTINTPKSRIYINVPRGDSVNGLLGSLSRLNFDVLHAATNNRLIDGGVKRLVNEGPIVYSVNISYNQAQANTLKKLTMHTYFV